MDGIREHALSPGMREWLLMERSVKVAERARFNAAMHRVNNDRYYEAHGVNAKRCLCGKVMLPAVNRFCSERCKRLMLTPLFLSMGLDYAEWEIARMRRQ